MWCSSTLRARPSITAQQHGPRAPALWCHSFRPPRADTPGVRLLCSRDEPPGGRTVLMRPHCAHELIPPPFGPGKEDGCVLSTAY